MHMSYLDQESLLKTYGFKAPDLSILLFPIAIFASSQSRLAMIVVFAAATVCGGRESEQAYLARPARSVRPSVRVRLPGPDPGGRAGRMASGQPLTYKAKVPKARG